jgi:NAD(P)-dependent dehydrogenase (short-subunit alcohol dehydrogenase family)
MGRLDGRIAFVTGGARGIGRAIAGKFAAEGATVTFADLDEAAGRETAAELAAAGLPVSFSHADVTVEAEVQRAIDGVATRHGTIDVLVNNAGVNAYFDAIAMTGADWDRLFGVDLKSAWLCAKYALPPMKRAGRGSIVNIASIHAVLTIPGTFPYAAAKAGLLGLTRSLALEYGPAGIRVNAVLPGYTRTRLVEEWLRTQPDPVAAERRVLEVQPLRRMAEPEEIANLVAFVASDEASAITGASLAADCGLGVMFAT